MSHVSATTYEGLNRTLAALAGAITSARYGDGNGGIIPVNALPALLVEVETLVATIEDLKASRLSSLEILTQAASRRAKRARPSWDALAGWEEMEVDDGQYSE